MSWETENGADAGAHDSTSFCRPSLGLGNPARAGILEGDVLGALKIEQDAGASDSISYCRPSLGLGNPARTGVLEGDVSGAHVLD